MLLTQIFYTTNWLQILVNIESNFSIFLLNRSRNILLIFQIENKNKIVNLVSGIKIIS